MWVYDGQLGATTENPSFSLNSALLSRCRVVTLQQLTPAQLAPLLQTALDDTERGLGLCGVPNYHIILLLLRKKKIVASVIWSSPSLLAIRP
eukprot:COSAG05_NODE_1003_length_6237_cov_7.337732_4_plen_92_part_00